MVVDESKFANKNQDLNRDARLKEFKDRQKAFNAFVDTNAKSAYESLGQSKAVQQQDKNNMFFLGNTSNLTGGVLITASSANAVTAAAAVAFGTLMQSQSKVQDEGYGGLTSLSEQTGKLALSFTTAEQALAELAGAVELGSGWPNALTKFDNAFATFKMVVNETQGMPTPDKKGILHRTWDYWKW